MVPRGCTAKPPQLPPLLHPEPTCCSAGGLCPGQGPETPARLRWHSSPPPPWTQSADRRADGSTAHTPHTGFLGALSRLGHLRPHRGGDRLQVLEGRKALTGSLPEPHTTRDPRVRGSHKFSMLPACGLCSPHGLASRTCRLFLGRVRLSSAAPGTETRHLSPCGAANLRTATGTCSRPAGSLPCSLCPCELAGPPGGTGARAGPSLPATASCAAPHPARRWGRGPQDTASGQSPLTDVVVLGLQLASGSGGCRDGEVQGAGPPRGGGAGPPEVWGRGLPRGGGQAGT